MTRIIYIPIIILISSFAAFISCGEDSNLSKYPYTDSLLSADSIMIQYEVQSGGDKALIFVHCWCCDRSYWVDQVDAFKDNYSVITVDLAGHGESGENREQWTISAYGHDIAAVVEKLSLDDVILIGHSIGGNIIFEAARLMPERVTALVGVDTYRNLNQKYNEEDQKRFLNNFRIDFSGYTRQFARFLFDSSADSNLVNSVANDMASAPEEIAINSMQSLMNYYLPDSLDGFNIPIYAINGEKFPTESEENKKILPNSEAVVIPGTGHFPHREKPNEFNAELQKALDKFWHQ